MDPNEAPDIENDEQGDAPGPAAHLARAVAQTVPSRVAWALRHVLKVFVTRVDPNYAQPWQVGRQRQATGSAFVLDAARRLIITNSHVVANSTSCYVRRPGNPKKFKAVVRCEAKVCDLALLDVEEPGFWGAAAAAAEEVAAAAAAVGGGQQPSNSAGGSSGAGSGDGPSTTCGGIRRRGGRGGGGGGGGSGGGGGGGAGCVPPLTFVDVPALQSPICVAGYPVGGDSLSITKGIVSRVTMARYMHSSNVLPSIQIDAAINPGNSGGPAFSSLERGEVAGVAFSRLTKQESIGFIIPMSVVNHFTSEYLATGTFRGVPAAGFRAQDSENEHLRKYLQLPDGASGCMVYALDPLSGAAGVLQPQDVVTRVDGLPVADDGTVQFRDDERLDVSHVISAKHVGDTLSVAVWRGGRELELRYCLGPPNSLVPMIHGVDCSPQYYIIGGCVFCPLSLPFLEAVLGVKWRSGGPPALLALLAKYRSESGQQVVVLSQVLASDVNFGYQRLSCVRCLTFNGTPLHNLAHLVQLVDGCDSDFMRFGLEGDSVVVLGSKEARDAGPTILRDHAISADRSADLAAATSANAATAAATAAAAGPAAAGSVERPLFGAAAAPAAATTAPDSSIGDTLSNADKPATHGGGGGGGTAQAD